MDRFGGYEPVFGFAQARSCGNKKQNAVKIFKSLTAFILQMIDNQLIEMIFNILLHHHHCLFLHFERINPTIYRLPHQSFHLKVDLHPDG
jgi:hypothetical protein